jgi:hypothetical protein
MCPLRPVFLYMQVYVCVVLVRIRIFGVVDLILTQIDYSLNGENETVICYIQMPFIAN